MTGTRRVVITGLGIVSCIGTDQQSVVQSLRAGRSGLSFAESYRDIGMKSQVAGFIDVDPKPHIDRHSLRFMNDASVYASLSLQQAIADAGLEPELVSNPRTGVIAGSGGNSTKDILETADYARAGKLRAVGAYRVPRTMSSSVSACLAEAFRIRGVNYSISSACATSTHCIGNAAQLIAAGQQDVVFAGGGEGEHWSLSCMFDSMHALSTAWNDEPTRASRAYDKDRDGFVIAAGGGMVVLEALEHAERRGAPQIHAELAGYGATADGGGMVLAATPDGAVACMRQALAGMDGQGLPEGSAIDYINTHGTSTPQGDIRELHALREVFGAQLPPFSSTKSLTGHSLGATGAQEAIYCLLMMREDFIAASANVDQLDPAITEEFGSVPLVTERRDQVRLNHVLSSSFGFGGTNAALLFRRHEDAAR